VINIIQVNLHKHKRFGYNSKWVDTGVLYIYCGRSKKHNPLSLGNPYPVNNETPRGKSIAKFKTYFVDKDNPLLGNLSDYIFKLIEDGKLQKLYLGCFCKPKACHTDVIAEELMKQLKTKDKEKHDRK